MIHKSNQIHYFQIYCIGSKERERGDLKQLYKIERAINQVNKIERGAPRRGGRGHLHKEILATCQQKSKFFINRVVNVWNSLPDAVSGAFTTNSFKKVQQSYLSSHSTDWKLRARA